MVPLIALKLSFLFWKHTLSVSKRLSGRTWVALAVLNATIAAVSFWAYQAKGVSESAIPPVYYAHVPFELMPETSMDSRWVMFSGGSIPVASASMDNLQLLVFGEQLQTQSWGSALIRSLRGTPQAFSTVLSGNNYQPYGHVSIVMHLSPDFVPPGWKMPRWPNDSARIVVQLPSEAPSLLTPTQQTIALLVNLLTTFFTSLIAFIAWQKYRRLKAQEILLKLQILMIQKELADRNKQDEKEAEKSRIILIE